MSSFPPVSPRRRFRPVGPARSLTLALSAAAGLASPALATPIVPAAAPLSADLPAYPATCPRAAELDGTLATDQLTKLMKKGLDEGTILGFALPSVPSPAVFVCDPAAAGARRILGPITGDTTAPVSRDLSWFGTRGLVLTASGTRVPSLSPGDRVALPVVAAGAQLTVSVATPGGARTLTVPPAPAAPTGVVIEGSPTAPTVVVERAGAPATRIAVAPRPKRTFKVRAQVSGSRVTLSGTAAPRTFLFAVSERKGHTSYASAVTGRSGRIEQLTLSGLTPKNGMIRIAAVHLESRITAIVHCRLTARRGTLSTARCSTNAASLADPANPIASQLSLHPGRDVASQFGRSASPTTATATSTSALIGTAKASARPVTAHAARAPKLATVEATVTEIVRQKAQVETALTSSDMNGDRRPDLLTVERQDTRVRPSLLASSGNGWTSVPIVPWPGVALEALPDLDGDGLGEFQAEGGAIVTDAFTGETPKQITLSAARTPSPRDLDLGSSDAPIFQAFQTFAEPLGALADITGDGRPEVALDAAGTLVYASETIVPGRRSRLADFSPVGVSEDQFSDFGLSAGEGAAYDAVEESQGSGISTLVIGQRVVTTRPADLNKQPATTRPIEIRTADASGAVLGSTTFQATGVARLVDHDPASGTSLVVLLDAGSCRRQSDRFTPKAKRPKGRRCVDRLVRVLPDGTVAATVSLPRIEDELIAGTFITDGPDADALPDVAVTARSSTTSAPEVVPSRPTDGGTVAVLSSVRTGAIAITALPVLAERGKVLQSVIGFSSTRTTDGSLWLAGGFQTETETESPAALDRLEQRVALVTQAP